jgi:hypothetical protein
MRHNKPGELFLSNGENSALSEKRKRPGGLAPGRGIFRYWR